MPGAPHIFVAGDLASIPRTERRFPGVPCGHAGGKTRGPEHSRPEPGGTSTPFRYVDKGSFAVIGRGAAVGDLFGWKMVGRLAWLAWLGIHITFLIGFRNRLIVLLGWAYSYFTHRRGARLITGN